MYKPNSQKRKNNFRNIVHGEYAALCGPRPGTQQAKKKPKNIDSEYLLGDNLKTDAKMAKTASSMFKQSSLYDRKRGHSNSTNNRRQDNNNKPQDFLYHGRKANAYRKFQDRSSKDFHRNQGHKGKNKDMK